MATKNYSMTKPEAKEKVKDIIKKTLALIPPIYEEDLLASQFFLDIPDWHDYEREIWMNGEKIRQILSEHKSLRKDTELLDLFLVIALNRNAKRGRESFIMLFWYKHCAKYADLLITQIDDDFVVGHIIQGLNKMQTGQFVSLVEPHTKDKIAWIRNQAKKYIEKYSI